MIWLILFSLALYFWIHAERHLGIGARVCGGLLCIALMAFGGYALAGVGHGYERLLHKNAIRMAGELLLKGETKRVEQAISTYNSIAATNTYTAAMEMGDVLSQAPKK